MMKNKHFLAAMLLTLACSTLSAQTDATSLPTGKQGSAVVIPADVIRVHYNGNLTTFPCLSNCDYTLQPVWAEGEEPWFTIDRCSKGKWKIKADYWYKPEERIGQVDVVMANGHTHRIQVIQDANNGSDVFSGDIPVEVSRAQASETNSLSESITKSLDDDPLTHYCSKWRYTEFPVTLDYFFKKGEHIDYLVYTPRPEHINGRWGEVDIQYTTNADPTNFITVKRHDFGFSAEAASVKISADDVHQVRFVVHTGQNGYATCAEMDFFAYNPEETINPALLFTDNLCYALKPGITEKDIMREPNPFLRQLAYYLLKEDYDTTYRVGEYEPYETLGSISRRLKVSSYNRYENPTGLFFDKDDRNIIFVDGLQDQYTASLIIKDFGGTGKQPESRYPLKNGLNVITAKNRGNGYIAYFTDDYAQAPNIRIHFPFAKVNGYFDLDRGDTNEDWKKLLANACSDIIDIRCKRLQVAFTTERLRKVCPDRAVELALSYDSVIYYERKVMGLQRYGIEPKNRQFARCIWDGFMHADGVGAAVHESSSSEWMQPDRSKFGFWGFGHELGHVNQVRPGLKWAGCGETTNNIYSAWVAFKLSGKDLDIERQPYGIREFAHVAGGRYNCYLEEGVRMGKSWLLQNGYDYQGEESKPAAKMKVPHEDYTGYRCGRDTTVISANHDHFVKLFPLWQLLLYCDQVGASPDVYGKVCQSIRTTDETHMTDGQLQIKFIRTVCDSTQLNFLPFFEKAGMFKPINSYIQDYGCDWVIINQQMLDEVSQHVKAKGYPTPKAEINYISGLNWQVYAKQLPLTGGKLNEGCSIPADKRFIKIDHKVWQNAVAFETYDANDKLIRISMMGLGADSKLSYTTAMWPSNAAYIMAVGWDGTRIKCYAR